MVVEGQTAAVRKGKFVSAAQKNHHPVHRAPEYIADLGAGFRKKAGPLSSIVLRCVRVAGAIVAADCPARSN